MIMCYQYNDNRLFVDQTEGMSLDDSAHPNCALHNTSGNALSDAHT